MAAPASHHIFYGQSKSVGTQAFNGSGNVKSTSALSGAVSFNQGISAWQVFQGADPRAANTTDALKRANFVDLVEEKVGSDGETGAYGFAEAYRWMMASRKGITSTGDYKLIMSSAGQGNRRMDQLAKGGAIYPRILADIEYGHLRSVSGGFSNGLPRRYAVESLVLDQGEDDASAGTSKTDWKNEVTGWKADVEADAATLTGISRSIPLFIPQTASHAVTGGNFDIAEAQLELGTTPGNGIYCPCPMYPFEYASPPNGVHFTAQGAYERGLYCGIAAYYAIEEGKDFVPVHPVEYEVDDVFLRVRFDGVIGKLVLSNPAQVPQAQDNGFVLRRPDGTVNPLRAPTAALGDWIEFRFDTAVTPGSVLKNTEGSGVGPNGPRCNLRDSQGDSIVIGGRRMDNWCVLFEMAIA